MNTQQLESFVQVAEDLNFARAAEALNITQSAVSRQIHSLEDELGTKLFHRSTRTVTLTAEGMDFLETAKSVLGKLRAAATKLTRNEQTNIQIVNIGCTNEATLEPLRSTLKECCSRLPDVHPFIRIIPHRSILNLFYQDEIDILFSAKEDIPLRGGTVYRELAKVPLCGVLPAEHSLADKERINLEELFTEKTIICMSHEVPPSAYELQNRIARQLLPASVYISDNVRVALSLVRAGYGCTVLPSLGLFESELCYVPLNGIEPISYGIFYKKSAQNVIKQVIAIVRRSDKQL